MQHETADRPNLKRLSTWTSADRPEIWIRTLRFPPHDRSSEISRFHSDERGQCACILGVKAKHLLLRPSNISASVAHRMTEPINLDSGIVPAAAADASPAVPAPVHRQPAPRPAVDKEQLLETRVSVIREGDSVMLKLPSDVIRVVTVQKEG